MGSVAAAPAEAIFTPDSIPQVPEDPLYSLVAAYEADKLPIKVGLGVGAYRNNNARPWILPVIKNAKEICHSDPDLNHEYLPIAGLTEFSSAAQKLILGADLPAMKESRVFSF